VIYLILPPGAVWLLCNGAACPPGAGYVQLSAPGNYSFSWRDARGIVQQTAFRL
jgi:hypothetical protein